MLIIIKVGSLTNFHVPRDLTLQVFPKALRPQTKSLHNFQNPFLAQYLNTAFHMVCDAALCVLNVQKALFHWSKFSKNQSGASVGMIFFELTLGTNLVQQMVSEVVYIFV